MFWNFPEAAVLGKFRRHIMGNLRMRPFVEELKTEEKKKPGKLARLWSLLDGLAASRFTGSITLHFSQGAVGRIEKYEEILRK